LLPFCCWPPAAGVLVVVVCTTLMGMARAGELSYEQKTRLNNIFFLNFNAIF
jgi:hypothetical protein